MEEYQPLQGMTLTLRPLPSEVQGSRLDDNLETIAQDTAIAMPNVLQTVNKADI